MVIKSSLAKMSGSASAAPGDGRRSEVILLDGRRVELIIQRKLFAGDLFDIVCSHFQLKEKQYFGLAFLDETGQYSWLNLDKRVLDHEWAKRHAAATATNSGHKLVLHFLVKYFVQTVVQLTDTSSVELFYLQARSLVANQVIQVDQDTGWQLSALVMQATYGDYTDDDDNDSKCKNQLKRHQQQLIPTYLLKELPSLAACEEKIIGHYRQLTGQTRGQSIVKYMSLIEKQPTYGVHFYEVRDKSGIPYWLGLSYKGIDQFDYADRRIPRRTFLWKQLENLYFREKKFSIEVRDPKRVVHALSSVNLYENAIEESRGDLVDDLSSAITDPTTQVSVSRRTFGPCNVTVYVWFAANPCLTKCIWSMAVAQHQFYIDRRNSVTAKNHLNWRSADQIADELTANKAFVERSERSSGSSSSRSQLTTGSSSQQPHHHHHHNHHQRTISSHSLPALCIENETLDNLETNKRNQQKQMFDALKIRKEALEEAMNKKLKELKELCLKEGELTGELPPETPLNANEPIPVIRRRVGTGFTLNNSKLIGKPKTKQEANLMKLELEYEIQSKIVAAAARLAKDGTTKKIARRQRKHAYQQSLAKLKDLEGRLVVVRRQIAASKQQLSTKSSRRRSSHQSTEDLSDDNMSHSTDESSSTTTQQLEKCGNSLNKFFVTEDNNNQTSKQSEFSVRRTASLYTGSIPSTPNPSSSTAKEDVDHHQQRRRRPLSPSVISLVNRTNAIQQQQRPRSAAAASEPGDRRRRCGFDYDTDEESNEMLRNLEADNNSNNNNNDVFASNSDIASSCGNGSVIYLADDDQQQQQQEINRKRLLMAEESTYINKFETSVHLTDSSNLYSVPNRRTSIAIKSQDDTTLLIRSPVKHQFKEPLVPAVVNNKHHRQCLQNDNMITLLLRSNSLDNSSHYQQRRRSDSTYESYHSPTNSVVVSSSTSTDPQQQHHKHYQNHYPLAYRLSRTSLTDNHQSDVSTCPPSPTTLTTGTTTNTTTTTTTTTMINPMAQRQLPTLPIESPPPLSPSITTKCHFSRSESSHDYENITGIIIGQEVIPPLRSAQMVITDNITATDDMDSHKFRHHHNNGSQDINQKHPNHYHQQQHNYHQQHNNNNNYYHEKESSVVSLRNRINSGPISSQTSMTTTTTTTNTTGTTNMPSMVTSNKTPIISHKRQDSMFISDERMCTTKPSPPLPVLKSWTETSLDFVVLPTKQNQTAETRPTTILANDSHNIYVNTAHIMATIDNAAAAANNSDPSKELYVNVQTMAHMMPTSSSSSVSSSSAPETLSSSHSTTPSPPLPTPPPPALSSPTPSYASSCSTLNMINNNNRNSIASISSKWSLNGCGGGDYQQTTNKPTPIPMSPTIPSGNGVEVTVVSVGQFQPYWEEEKPFELSDFYKYSKKHNNNNNNSTGNRQSRQSVSSISSCNSTTPLPSADTPTSLSPIYQNCNNNNNINNNNNTLIGDKNNYQHLHHHHYNHHHHLTTPSKTEISQLNTIQSPQSPLNESLKSQMIVSDSFTNELISWYDDHRRSDSSTAVVTTHTTITTTTTTTIGNNSSHNRDHNKKNPTLV
ncbi:probable serine/threonine-protein kinase DDB_G0282963 [Oppia nitens]|uniref:probable serine/threonine-protein kinase DDB_G0282963 n=1 Tax=Oppia nitens TaxID=1686743 RepID=UPI0023DAB682|nr:probable serine/threonine-protein kinase DDB_G0282963 [Oppia nitens]